MNDNNEESVREHGEPFNPAEDDPVVDFLQSEAQNLSYALTPDAVARKLRDTLQERFPDKALMYYIGGEYNSGVLSLEVAVKTPNFLASIRTENGGAEASIAWRTLTDGGWQIEVGLAARGSFARPSNSRVVSGGKFSITISR